MRLLSSVVCTRWDLPQDVAGHSMAQAGELFAGEEQTSESNKCRLKVSGTAGPGDWPSGMHSDVQHPKESIGYPVSCQLVKEEGIG